MMRFFAPAKINLMLHVTGRRVDGYHLLQSAMGLTDVGDVVHVGPSESYQLAVDGLFKAHAPEGEANLITMAVRAMEQDCGRVAQIAVQLQKNLPAGAGLGGGSADAAAVMHALNAMWGTPYSLDDLCALGLRLGAEMPFCLSGKPAFVEGIGDVLKPLAFASMHAVLIWPGVTLATADVFKAYAQSAPNYTLARDVADFESVDAIVGAGNDLSQAALSLCPVIAEAMDMLAQSRGCVFARMTGSGSSVFAVFDTQENAADASLMTSTRYPDWWARAVTINP